MLDYINYYYNLYPAFINEIDNKYMFYVNSEKYYMVLYDRNIEELDEILELNKKMILNDSLVHEIILNKYKEALNNYNGKLYILLRVYISDNKLVDINDVIYMLNESRVELSNYKLINRTDWSRLWENKIDYFEYQMGHVIKKYPILYSVIDYYLGIAENAIMYLRNVSNYFDGNIELGVCHKRIGVNYTLFDLYNPLNLVVDYKVRDLGEYIKNAFFNQEDVNEMLKIVYLNYYFDKLNLSLLTSRLLFPSYFFDEFEEIVYNERNENSVFSIIKKSSLYEDFISCFIKTCNLQSIGWLSKY